MTQGDNFVRTASQSGTGTISSGEQGCSASVAGTSLLVDAVKNLLWRFVQMVDSPTHGGWSLEDEEAVRAVVSALERAGSPIRTML
jgi:hypothetical protein